MDFPSQGNENLKIIRQSSSLRVSVLEHCEDKLLFGLVEVMIHEKMHTAIM